VRERTTSTRFRRRGLAVGCLLTPAARSTGHVLALGLLIAGGCASGLRPAGHVDAPVAPAPTRAQEPYFDARSHAAEYVGPGREVPPPGTIEEVKIGWFGPDDPAHPTAGQMWSAATLAVEEANSNGGYDGLPFRLVVSWSENPWGTGVRNVTRLVYDEDVWAIVGAPDGPSAHLIAQVVAKARLTFVSAVSTDKTTNLANVPWVFSCAPGDHVGAPILAEAIVSRTGRKNFAIVSCTDHDSRMFTTELLGALGQRRTFPALHLEFRPGAGTSPRSKAQSPKSRVRGSTPQIPPDFGPWTLDFGLPRLRQADPAAVVLIASPQDAAGFLRAMRGAGLTMPVFGGPAMGRRAFIEAAGSYADGVMFPLLWDASGPGERSAAFAQRFEEQFGNAPDYTAAHTYDAMNLLIAAIRSAGLNRVRIRDAIRGLSPWPGVTGVIAWDPIGQNRRPVGLGTIRDGRVTPWGEFGPRGPGRSPLRISCRQHDFSPNQLLLHNTYNYVNY